MNVLPELTSLAHGTVWSKGRARHNQMLRIDHQLGLVMASSGVALAGYTTNSWRWPDESASRLEIEDNLTELPDEPSTLPIRLTIGIRTASLLPDIASDGTWSRLASSFICSECRESHLWEKQDAFLLP